MLEGLFQPMHLLVIFFMVIYYNRSGFIADIAMLIGLPVAAGVYLWACRSINFKDEQRLAAAADMLASLEAMTAAHDAALLIGDPALEADAAERELAGIRVEVDAFAEKQQRFAAAAQPGAADRLAGLHVEEVIEESLVAGLAARLWPLRRVQVDRADIRREILVAAFEAVCAQGRSLREDPRHAERRDAVRHRSGEWPAARTH